MNEVEQFYNEHAAEYDKSYDLPEVKAEDELVKRWLLRDLDARPIFDVGCGTGWLLEHLQIKAARYYGIDISQGMVDQLKRKFPRHFAAKKDAERPWVTGPFRYQAVCLWMAANHMNTAALMFRFSESDARKLIVLGRTHGRPLDHLGPTFAQYPGFHPLDLELFSVLAAHMPNESYRTVVHFFKAGGEECLQMDSDYAYFVFDKDYL